MTGNSRVSRTFPLRLAMLGLLTSLGAFAGSTLAVWVATRAVYTGVTLGANSTRVDTVVVSDASKPREPKPDQFMVALSGTGQAATPDSQFHAVVKAIRSGKVHQIGEDSLMLRPDPPVAAVQSGEMQLLRWVADSLQITTRNPKSTSVTGTVLTVTAERLP